MQYLASKKELVRKLSAEETTKPRALVLSSHCCVLANIIWSQNRSLVDQDEFVEILIQHAEICVDLVSISLV